MHILMELACGNKSFACNRYLWPSVRSTIATPITPSRLRSTSRIDFSSFSQRTCCFSVKGGEFWAPAEADAHKQRQAKISGAAILLCSVGFRGNDFPGINQICASRKRFTAVSEVTGE